ncbi:MAG: carboxylesterase family protein [Roseburia sp.]|nr:carboxylesterase family protein [Roseburia sp.]
MIRMVETENGRVKGMEAADPRITAFKGIPFAAPPVGENRWRAPQPCKDWEGVLEAYRFAPISVQDTPGLGTDIYCREWHVDPEIPMDEDCLYLNIWTGAKTPEEKQPVVVWYFGGGLQWGYPAEMEFDGERLARRGIVVVTVNYRLNVFGFLAHPELTENQPDAPTNFGSLDQQAGLKWVIRNIAAFGGDPENITLAGQSAGGGSVLSQIACPANRGLFQKAIIQSAMICNPYGPKETIGTPASLEDAEKAGEAFFAFLGVDSLEEARKLDAFYIRDKYGEYAQNHPRMFSVEDKRFCVGDPLELIMKNQYYHIPMMAGNTADEFLSGIPADTKEELRRKAEEIFGDRAEEFLSCPEALVQDKDGSYASVSGIECMAKALFLKNRENGNAAPCYYYRFDADIPGWDYPGTFHSVELWFFFETLAKCWRPFVGKHYDLARQMCNYWCNFVKTGNPNGQDADGREMPVWKPYTKEEPFGMVFRTEGPCGEEEESSELKTFLVDYVKRRV